VLWGGAQNVQVGMDSCLLTGRRMGVMLYTMCTCKPHASSFNALLLLTMPSNPALFPCLLLLLQAA
jgi:hypothetical protein